LLGSCSFLLMEKIASVFYLDGAKKNISFWQLLF
jgi:hypothetical protein